MRSDPSHDCRESFAASITQAPGIARKRAVDQISQVFTTWATYTNLSSAREHGGTSPDAFHGEPAALFERGILTGGLPLEEAVLTQQRYLVGTIPLPSQTTRNWSAETFSSLSTTRLGQRISS